MAAFPKTSAAWAASLNDYLDHFPTVDLMVEYAFDNGATADGMVIDAAQSNARQKRLVSKAFTWGDETYLVMTVEWDGRRWKAVR